MKSVEPTVTGQTITNASTILVLDGVRKLSLAFLFFCFRLELKQGTILDPARWVRADFDGLRQEILVPASHEITMIAVSLEDESLASFHEKPCLELPPVDNVLTSSIPVGQDELPVLAVERIGIPDGLVQHRHDPFIETSRAIARHPQVRISHVAHVILAIGLPVPAAREHKLETEAVRTVGIKVGLVREKVTEQRRLGLFTVIQAIETKRLLSESVLRHVVPLPLRLGWIGDWESKVTPFRVTGDHLKTGWEGLNILSEQEVIATR